MLAFNFANITKHNLLKVKEVIFTISVCLFATVFYSITWTALFFFSASIDCSKVVHPLDIFPYAGHC